MAGNAEYGNSFFKICIAEKNGQKLFPFIDGLTKYGFFRL